MGREKRKILLPAGASGSKERHKRARRAQFDPLAPAPEGLVAKPAIPRSTHHTYFEFVANKDKKKKLEVQITRQKTPPPGFEFVPIGNPELTSACKELSREKDAMIFIVSLAADGLSQQVNRLGHHVRQTIVEEAKEGIADLPQSGAVTPDGKPESIPESQAEYHAQADAALRDLFPRIPNTDRQIIIDHAFTRRENGKAEQPVGFSDDIPLARRVQLAVLAHIRHDHTTYDKLLKEAGWQRARKAVEELCLDIIVKWRGDEETGRDQLDEILREVVIISDSEDDESDEDITDDSSTEDLDLSASVPIIPRPVPVSQITIVERGQLLGATPRLPRSLGQAKGMDLVKSADFGSKTGRNNQRGFKRYRAWQEAIRRNRDQDTHASGFFARDTGEYDPSRPQIHPEHGDGHQPSTVYSDDPFEQPARPARFQVSAGHGIRDSPTHRHLVNTPPPFSNHITESRLPRNNLNPLAYEHQTNGLSSGIMSPISHRLRDVLVPSIEPISSETMKPAFVRPVPSRQHDPMDHLTSRTQELFHQFRSLSPTDDLSRDAPDQGSRQVISDHAFQRLQPCDFTIEAAPFYVFPDHTGNPSSRGNSDHAGPSAHGWARPDEQLVPSTVPRANRIVVNASRPGTRSNPILMEDRGGFYERVASAQEQRRSLHTDGSVAELEQEPFTATQSYRMVSSGEGSRILRDGCGNASVEVIPLSRSGPMQYPARYHAPPPHSQRPVVFSHPGAYGPPLNGLDAGRQHTPGQQQLIHRRPIKQESSSLQAERPIHQSSYRMHAKRPASDDHYQNNTRDRRPRSRQPENVIVLD